MSDKDKKELIVSVKFQINNKPIAALSINYEVYEKLFKLLDAVQEMKIDTEGTGVITGITE